MKPTRLLTALLLVSACAHTPVLEPDPDDSLAQGSSDVATAQVAGVRVLVSGDKWNSDPQNLGDVFTPVQVTIFNQSNHPLRLAYDGFKLNGANGFVHPALPPLQAKAVLDQVASRETKRTVVLAGHERLTTAPAISLCHNKYYAFARSPEGREYWPEQLPTKAMLDAALLEGALQNGGKVTGFLYFQLVSSSEARVSFEMDLIDANNGRNFGHLSIPFDVSR